ncbi:alpha/beta hydrolase [Cryobacterium psychrophilum]|uniref:Alpha/beta hydrolase n=1 Tax=Cryobacterium psychrophilum TaxID=41988 RepID=A0A4Y8KPX7_9MICO|nr:alpha/beta hydrolase [Cryobacterium psychrophilum]TDW29860.1 phospholipase/carboxylesterase [Cryobacterium psychrophilum]TFD76755.1 alpha/beta hydrolase [Cryobacterium psychrophilum]
MHAIELAEWPYLYREGVGTVLLMLHGTGGNEQEIAELGQQLDPDAAVLAPRGRVRENGSNRWFRRLEEGIFDVDDVVQRAGELAELVESAQREYGLQNRPLVAVGFSNGANIALATMMLHPTTITRVVAFSGMYPFADRDAPAQISETDALMLNGSADPLAPASSVDRLESELLRHGASVTRFTRTGGHGITPEEVAEAHRWVRGNGTRPPVSSGVAR